jgi:hypothetical protein
MSSKSSPKTDVFKYVQKFQERIGLELFKNEREISSAVSDRNRKGEFVVHLTHRNGVRMSLILCTWDQPESVRVVFSEKTVFNSNDWYYLQNHVIRYTKEAENIRSK